MNKADILELARNVDAANERVRVLNIMGSPTNLEHRISAAAQYRPATDAQMRAHQEYNAAISALSTEELTELASIPNA